MDWFSTQGYLDRLASRIRYMHFWVYSKALIDRCTNIGWRDRIVLDVRGLRIRFAVNRASLDSSSSEKHGVAERSSGHGPRSY